ncbi:MAG: hypothetical protein ACJA0G_002439 [Kangiellaceae bacterium]|jgi:hypothetical protein
MLFIILPLSRENLLIMLVSMVLEFIRIYFAASKRRVNQADYKRVLQYLGSNCRFIIGNWHYACAENGRQTASMQVQRIVKLCGLAAAAQAQITTQYCSQPL